jgi:hypothetical protein
MADVEEEDDHPGWANFDAKTWTDLSRDEKRTLHRKFLFEQAAGLGMELRQEDYEHEDMDEELDRFCMSDEQIRKIQENERKLIRRVVEVSEAAALEPAPRRAKKQPQAQPNAPQRKTHEPVPNVVRDDDAIRSGVSDELKTRLMAYAPVERIYALVCSWRLKGQVFHDVEHFSGQLVRFGCTCITKPDGVDGGTCEYTLDAYYQTKKEEAEKKRMRRKEIRTAKSVARQVARISTLLRNADPNAPMIVGDDEDDETLRDRALATATGNASSFSQNMETLEEIDVAPFADDHVQLIVDLRRRPGRAGLLVHDAHFVVRDVVY